MRPIAPCALVVLLACASAQRGSPTAGERRARVNGTDLAYTMEGSGPLLVIVHGAWGDYRSWSTVASALARQHTVVRVSLRLHWPNRWPTSEVDAYARYREAIHAADVAALIEKLGRGRADVLGHSYGGDVATMLALSRPDLVHRLVLAEAMLLQLAAESPGKGELLAGERRWQDKMLKQVRAEHDQVAILKARFDEDGAGTWDGFPESKRVMLAANAATTGPFAASDYAEIPYSCQNMRQIQGPVLLLEGDKGDTEAHAMGSRLLECVPRGSRVRIPNATHSMQFTEPEAVARAVVAFLER
jgi:esterase